MNNCIQITIGKQKYQFRDVDMSKSSSLNDIIQAIVEDPNYASQLENLNDELNQSDLNIIENVDEIPEDVTDRNTYIADYLMGNVNPYTLVQIYKRTGVPHSEFLTAFKTIMERGKSNKLSFLISSSPTQVFLGNKRDLVVLNKNDMYNMPKVLGALSYVYAHNQLLDNQTAIYKIVESIYNSIMEEPTALREELSKIPDKYSAFRRLLYYTQSARYADRPEIINLKTTLSNHIFGEVVKNIKLNKNRNYFRDLALNSIQFKSLENLAVKQEFPASINFGNSSISVNDLNRFRIDFLNVEKMETEDVVTDDMLILRLTALNPNGAFDTNLFPTNKGQRLLLMTNPIAAFVYDISNLNKISKYVEKFSDSTTEETELQEKLVSAYTTFGRGRLDVNTLILDFIQEASTNRLDFTNAEDLQGFETLFIPNVDVHMDESLTSAPSRVLKFNHSSSQSKFTENGIKFIFNPKVKYIEATLGARTNNPRIEINPDFNLDVDEEYENKIAALMKVADAVNSSKSSKRVLVMKYDEHYDYSLENGVTNINKAASAFSTFLSSIVDYLNPNKQFLYMNSDGIGQFAQAMVVVADHHNLSPVVFDQLSKGGLYDRTKAPNMAEWIKTFTSLMNSVEFTDSAVHHFYEWDSFLERAFSSKRTDSSGNVWKNLNDALTQMEEESDAPLSQFDLLKTGVISMIPTNRQKYNYGLRHKNVGDIFRLKSEKNKENYINVELEDKLILTHRHLGSRNLDESKSLQPGDVFRPNLISNYQVTVLEARNNGYLCAWIDDKGFHSDIWTKDDLKEVERTQYTAQVRELFNGDRAVYTNLGVFVQRGDIVQYVHVKNTAKIMPILYDFFSPEITEISNKTGFSENFIRRNYLSSVDKLRDAIFMDFSLTDATIDTNTSIDVLTNSDNLSTPEFVEDLAKSLSDNGVGIRTLTMEEMKEQFPMLNNVKAFVYDGDVILNRDLMTDDTLVHEISHLFLADLKFRRPDTYYSLVDKMEGSEIYEDINVNGAYDELSHSDKLEEALVHEFSDYFTRVLKDYRGRNINLEEVDWESILSDALNIDISEFYDEDIYSIMQLTLTEFHNNYSTQKTLYNKQNALKSIRLSNIKSELLKNASTDSGYRLIEICE